jgi:hypothetical protein
MVGIHDNITIWIISIWPLWPEYSIGIRKSLHAREVSRGRMHCRNGSCMGTERQRQWEKRDFKGRDKTKIIYSRQSTASYHRKCCSTHIYILSKYTLWVVCVCVCVCVCARVLVTVCVLYIIYKRAREIPPRDGGGGNPLRDPLIYSILTFLLRHHRKPVYRWLKCCWSFPGNPGAENDVIKWGYATLPLTSSPRGASRVFISPLTTVLKILHGVAHAYCTAPR